MQPLRNSAVNLYHHAAAEASPILRPDAPAFRVASPRSRALRANATTILSTGLTTDDYYRFGSFSPASAQVASEGAEFSFTTTPSTQTPQPDKALARWPPRAREIPRRRCARFGKDQTGRSLQARAHTLPLAIGSRRG